MKKKKPLIIFLATVVLVIVAAAVAATRSSGSSAMTRMSAKGVAATLSPRSESGLQRGGTPVVRLLGNRGGSSFYEIDTDEHGRCFGLGHGGTTDGVLSFVACPGPTAFPSIDRPIAAFADAGSSSHARGDIVIDGIQGFAADGIASIDLAAGSESSTTPVVGNIFSVTFGAPVKHATLTARDATGKVVFSQAF
jgi:hypothetical protein